jgi:hypothetical protein
MRRSLFVFSILFSVAPWACWRGDTNPAGNDGNGGPSIPPNGSAWVVFGSDTVTAEVSDTDAERERGLMFRERIEEGEGMLFVWVDEDIRSFWMRNTYIPLDVAFLDRSSVVLNIRQMEPETEDLHYSEGPAMFALEVPRGWLALKGIGPGNRAEIVFGPR